MKHKIKIGRYTAGLLLFCTGALLLADEWNKTDHIFLLLTWWPALFVLWGAEYILRYFFSRIRGRRGEFRFRPDLKGIIVSVLVAASVFIVSQQEHFLHLWNRVSLNLTAAGVDYSEAADNRFVKSPLEIPVELETSKIIVDHLNGDIAIHRVNSDHITVRTEVWVDQEEPGLAEAIAEQSVVEADDGSIVSIRSQGKPYGQSGKRQPRMNMDIAIPDDRRFDLEVRTMNGALALLNVEAINHISLESGNGPITLSRVYGDVTGKTLNGNVSIRNVTGDIELSTNSGSIQAYDVAGKASLTTQVGNIKAKRISDDTDVRTKNGNIMLAGHQKGLNAESLNGGIDIRSGVVGGDWTIYSAVGVMNLHVPLVGDYHLKGTISYGKIQSDIPFFMVEQKTIEGTLGSGEYAVKVEGNSDLNIYRSYPEPGDKKRKQGQTPMPH